MIAAAADMSTAAAARAFKAAVVAGTMAAVGANNTQAVRIHILKALGENSCGLFYVYADRQKIFLCRNLRSTDDS